MKLLIAILLITLPYAVQAECPNYVKIVYMGPRDYPIQHLQIGKAPCDIPFSWSNLNIKTIVVPDTIYNYLLSFIKKEKYIKKPEETDTVDMTGFLKIEVVSPSAFQPYLIGLKPECNLFLMKLITRFEIGRGITDSMIKSKELSDLIYQLKFFLSVLYVE